MLSEDQSFLSMKYKIALGNFVQYFLKVLNGHES